VLTKDSHDGNAVRLNRKVNGVGESVDQGAPSIFFNDWEAKGIVRYVFERRANFVSNLKRIPKPASCSSYHNAVSLMSTCASGRTEMLRIIGYLA
jgi:hypothetical protein